MKYIDPYDLFSLDVASPDDLDRQTLKRAKQKALAEFELSGEVVVQFGRYEIDKATALRLLDELEDPVLRKHHFFMHRQPDLRLFLEEDKLRLLRNIPPADELGDADFRKFLSKQLAPILDRHLSENLRALHKPEVALLLQRLDLIDPWDLDRAMQGSLRFLNQNIQAIKEAAGLHAGLLYKFDEPALWSLDLVKLLNRLPNVYQHVRNRYAEALKDLALALENTVSRTFVAYTVICMASELEVDLSTAEYINYAKVELWRRQRDKKQREADYSEDKWRDTYSEWQENWQQENFSGEEAPKRGSRGLVPTMVGLILFLVLFMAIRHGNWGSGSGSSSFYSYDSPTIEMPNLDAIAEMSKVLEDIETGRRSAEAFLDSLERAVDFEYVGVKEGYRAARGDAPYAAWWEDSDRSVRDCQVALDNASDFDIVFFVQDMTSRKFESHVFLPSGSISYTCDLRFGFKRFAVYAGHNWRGGVVPYNGENLPGFTKDAMVFGMEDLRIGNIESSNQIMVTPDKYGNGASTQKITFNGKGLELSSGHAF